MPLLWDMYGIDWSGWNMYNDHLFVETECYGRYKSLVWVCFSLY